MKAISVHKHFGSFKKGSRKNRLVLDKKFCNNNILPSVVNDFAEVAGIYIQDSCNLTIFGIWGKSFLPTEFRDFLYKYFFNKLGLKTRTSHFAETNRKCTFCEIISQDLSPVNDESFHHLFVVCPTVLHVHEQIIGAVFDENFEINVVRSSGSGLL
jgi:hypothetical protein